MENRQLLAADIAVHVDELVVDDNNMGTAVVRIFNNGDDDAIDVEITSRLTDQFVNPTWRRERGYAQFVRPNESEQPSPTLQGSPSHDINGDGRNDFFVRSSDKSKSAIVWGGAFPNDEFTPGRAIRAITDTPSGSLGVVIPEFCCSVWTTQPPTTPATFIGDINADGYADLAFNRGRPVVMLGGPDLATRPPEEFFSFNVSLGFSNGFDSPFEYSENAIYAGDVNGDGTDDLLVWDDVGTTCLLSCTQIDRDLISLGLGNEANIRSEALVILGRPDFARDTFDRNSAEVLSFTFSGRPRIRAADYNRDGINDLIFRESNVVFGGQEIESRTFFLNSIDYKAFNGEDGHQLTSGAFATPRTETVVGEGDITQLEEIPAGQSLLYYVNGAVQLAPRETITTSALTSARDRNLRNNFSVDSPAVYLDVVAGGRITTPEKAEITIEVTNFGPDLATDLQLDESVTSLLDNATWHRKTQATWASGTWSETRESPFPKSIVGSQWTQALGPSTVLSGMVDLGDINGDGFDDLYLDGGFHFGNEFFGYNGNFGDSLKLQSTFPRWSLGDINYDGFDDFLASIEREPHIVLGQPDFPTTGDLNIVQSDLTTLKLAPSLSEIIPAGDINGDGFDDWIKGRNVILGSPEQDLQEIWRVRELNEANSIFLSATEGTLFSAKPIGDLNADGITDIGISQWLIREGKRVTTNYVLFGGSHWQLGNLDIEELPKLAIENATLWMEYRALTSIGDLNHDGIDDLLVGDVSNWAPGDTPSNYVIYGSHQLPSAIDVKTLAPDVGFSFFSPAASKPKAADLNGDGSDELIILHDEGATIVFGDPEVSFQNYNSFSELRADERFQQTEISDVRFDIISSDIVTGFDVNGDGAEDLLLSDPWGGTVPPPPNNFMPTGATNMLLGRPKTRPIRTGPIGSEPIDIPVGYTATFNISGLIRDGEGLDLGRITVATTPQQTNLNQEDASSVVRLLPYTLDPPFPLLEPMPLGEGNIENSGDGDFADLDGDGDLDLFLTVDGGSNQVWLNNGSGRFHDSSQRLGGETVPHIYSALGDVDGDGDIDAVVATLAGHANQIWLNDGVGNFSLSDEVLGDSSLPSIDIALADLNGDGALDVYVANTNQSPDEVFLNDGQGRFVEFDSRLGQPTSSKSAVAADVDGDGDMDMVVATLESGAHIHINRGDGRIKSTRTFGSPSEHVAVGDLDNDGDVDLVFANPGANEIWWNDGVGQFTLGAQLLDDGLTSHVELGDLDNDGDLDVVAANWLDEPSRIWINESGWFVDAGLLLDRTNMSEHIGLGDIDGDGDLDILLATRGGQNLIYSNEFGENEVQNSSVPADLDDDGEVGFSDFLILASNFGNSDPKPFDGDINEDGTIDFADFLILASFFGTNTSILP